MTRVRTIQILIAAVFLVLGGWCLLAPASIIDLSFRPEYRLHHPTVTLAIGCFGAQAMLAGIFAAFSRFTRGTFIAFGVAVLPFFFFNYYFYFVEPMFTRFIFLDAVGNLVFIVLCVYGALIAGAEQPHAEAATAA
jgi:hypothetical protein